MISKEEVNFSLKVPRQSRRRNSANWIWVMVIKPRFVETKKDSVNRYYPFDVMWIRAIEFGSWP